MVYINLFNNYNLYNLFNLPKFFNNLSQRCNFKLFLHQCYWQGISMN